MRDTAAIFSMAMFMFVVIGISNAPDQPPAPPAPPVSGVLYSE